MSPSENQALWKGILSNRIKILAFSELDFFQNEDSPEFIQNKLFEKRIRFCSTTKWTRK